MASIKEEYGIAYKAIEHHVKRSNIGLIVYPLTDIEKSIFSDIGKMSTENIAKKYGLTIDRLRNICSDRGVSLRVDVQFWTPIEINVCLKELVAARKENRPLDALSISALTGRTVSAVKNRLSKLAKQYPFL